MFRKKQSVAAAAAQLRGGMQRPFGAGLPAVPPGEAQLYRAMRQSLPVLDAAIGKLVRLSGGFTVRSAQQQAALNEFLRTVPCGRGQTGICDHQWSADRQVARIFDTQVVREDDGASCLMAEAYVLRTERNADLIADIEGGIKKEVSVGCAMGQARCSICGEPYGTCAHRKGAVYDGETCLAVLSEPLDAYEFSFVAVPAQRAAGVTKAGKEGYGMTLQDCVAKHGSPELSDALRRLSAEAELGRAWRKQLEDGLVALGLSLDLGASEQTLRKAAAALDDGQLQAWKAALDRRAAERYGGGPQLVRTQGSGKDDEAYLI